MKKITFVSIVVFLLMVIPSIHTRAEIKADVEGLAQFIYSWDEQDGDDQLDISRVLVNFTGRPAEKVYVFVSLEQTNHTSRNVPGAPNAAGARNALMDGNSDNRIVDAYADLSYWEKVTLRVGQFPLPISYELNTAPYDQETIMYSQGVGTFSYRDRGIIVFADPTPEFGWSGWIVNGAGAISGATSSRDDRSDFGVQLDYYPTSSFSMKAWGMWGEDASEPPFDTAAFDQKYDAFGLGLDYAIHNFHFFAEYNDMDREQGGIKLFDYQEWYLHASHKIPGTDVQVVLRYDEYDKDSWDSDPDKEIDQNITTLGLNWDFEKNSRLQIMRDFVDGSDNDKLDIQLSVRF